MTNSGSPLKRHILRILGSLLNTVVGGLAKLPTLGAIIFPRMATFARWGEAVSQHLGSEPGMFLTAFQGNQQSASAELLEDSPLATELMLFGRGKPNGWAGTAQDLLSELSEGAAPGNRSSLKWPKSPRSLSCLLRRFAPALRKSGMQVIFADRTNQSRLIGLNWESDRLTSPSVANFASLASLASQGENGKATHEMPQGQKGTRVPF